MDVKQAAKTMIQVIEQRFAEGDLSGEKPPNKATLTHVHWMLRGITLGYIQSEKAHRWLGYTQGVLVARKFLSVEQCKAINKGTFEIQENVSDEAAEMKRINTVL